jgi:hypothetical protein
MQMIVAGAAIQIIVAFSTIDDIAAAVSPYLVVPPECNYGLICIRAFDNLSRLSAKAGIPTAL